jgi:hypothetical protein
VPLPAFCTVKVKFGLEHDPTLTLPKLKLEGDTEIEGVETDTTNERTEEYPE